MTKLWRYKLEKDFTIYHTALHGISFKNEFIEIDNIKMTIRKDYAWDGCTPAFKVPLGALLPTGLWLGVWDGPKTSEGVPTAFYASLVHDALCQFRHDIKELGQLDSVVIFEDILKLHQMPVWLAKLYSFAVLILGPQDFNRC